MQSVSSSTGSASDDRVHVHERSKITFSPTEWPFVTCARVDKGRRELEKTRCSVRRGGNLANLGSPHWQQMVDAARHLPAVATRLMEAALELMSLDPARTGLPDELWADAGQLITTVGCAALGYLVGHGSVEEMERYLQDLNGVVRRAEDLPQAAPDAVDRRDQSDGLRLAEMCLRVMIERRKAAAAGARA